jgi:hypothetical protein
VLVDVVDVVELVVVLDDVVVEGMVVGVDVVVLDTLVVVLTMVVLLVVDVVGVCVVAAGVTGDPSGERPPQLLMSLPGDQLSASRVIGPE